MTNKVKTKSASTTQTLLKYDTKIGVIAEKYSVDLGAPNSTKLGDFLKDKGYGSLSEMLRT